MEKSSPWIMISVLAGVDAVYCLSVLGFLGAWQEHPPILRPVAFRLLAWGTIAVGNLVLAMLEFRTKTMTWILVLLPSTLLCIRNIVKVRRDLVEGGPALVMPAPNRDPRTSRVIIITGANAGIGKETALWFAKHEPSAEIILLCRNTSKGQQVIDEVIAANGHNLSKPSPPLLRVIACDLTNFASVRACVDEIKSSFTRIDLLIQNAGVMLKDLEYTEDGHEMALQANHLGHFLLSALLLPMVHGCNGRVIVLTSSTFPLCCPAKIPYGDRTALDRYLECRPPNGSYGLFSQYAKTKWCNILHAYYLFSVYGIWTAAVHPGLVRTDVVRNMPLFMKIGYRMTGWILASLQKTPKQGAWGTIYASNTTSDPGGCYWENRRIIPIDATLVKRAANPLWEWSCQAVQLSATEQKALEQCKKT